MASRGGFATGSDLLSADLATCRSEALLHGRSKFDRSQTFTVLSRLPETKSRPSELNDRPLTRPVWPRKLWTSFPARPTPSGFAEGTSQIFTALSSPAEATHRPSPSGLN